MEKTKTESLLQEALEICQRATNRVDVSDALLHAVFVRLDEELHDNAIDVDEDHDSVTLH